MQATSKISKDYSVTSRKGLTHLSSLVRIFLMLMLACLIVVAAVWHATERPSSGSEYRFLKRLSELPLSTQRHLDLAALMPGDWELVCDAHGYSGDFYLEKYGRKYPSVGEPQDGSWGLIFIDVDGSFTSASGNCKSAGVQIYLAGCATRTQAVLWRDAVTSNCPLFKN